MYYSLNALLALLKRSNSIIAQSLLKNGYSNFSLQILEYCDRSECLSREQFYLDLLQPEYNILKKAGSQLGAKRSPEARENMRLAQLKAYENPN